MTKAPLALTMGDPAGIGGEIAARAWSSKAVKMPFVAIDDAARLKALGIPVQVITDPAEASAVFPDALPVLEETLPVRPVPGQPHAANAASVIRSIERAVTLAQDGAASAVVTSPINKKALYDGAEFAYPGHTEFLAALADVRCPVMMLAAPGLRVVPATIHIPLAEVQRRLTTTLIVETGLVLATALRRDFGIQTPRVAVAGLNPHAGEGGAMGTEDLGVVAPAVQDLQRQGVAAFGPLPADTMFHEAARRTYDAALCMYHDQALIPVKMLDFARGVNITLGLPFIRTSPDHGTAYDIAGTGKADPTSLIEALNVAADMVARRVAPALAS
ncbi:MAG: 4-hydroxythreonine-4-phosphate dehydrogenase PdxA [Pseudomonadota bacterium]